MNANTLSIPASLADDAIFSLLDTRRTAGSLADHIDVDACLGRAPDSFSKIKSKIERVESSVRSSRHVLLQCVRYLDATFGVGKSPFDAFLNEVDEMILEIRRRFYSFRDELRESNNEDKLVEFLSIDHNDLASLDRLDAKPANQLLESMREAVDPFDFGQGKGLELRRLFLGIPDKGNDETSEDVPEDLLPWSDPIFIRFAFEIDFEARNPSYTRKKQNEVRQMLQAFNRSFEENQPGAGFKYARRKAKVKKWDRFDIKSIQAGLAKLLDPATTRRK